MRYTKIYCLALLLIVALKSNAQEMWGMANSNYAGNFAIDLNPASMAFSPIKYELNVLSGNVTFQNNYLYLPKGNMSIGKFFKADFFNYEWQDRYTTENKNAYVHGMVKGPSFFTRIGQTAFGLHSALRTDASVRNINYQLAKLFYEGSDFNPLQQQQLLASNNKVSGMMYGEIGGSFAQQFKASEGNKVSFGLTVNYLLGLNSIYAQNDAMTYTFDDASLLHISNLNADFGYAMPDEGKQNYFNIRGRGISTTWGFQYMHGLNPEAYNIYAARLKLKKYKYKLGASLIDAGSILFTSETKRYSYFNSSLDWTGFDTTKIDGIAHLGELISNKVLEESATTNTDTKYRQQLPTALSVQFDYCLTHFLYVNTSLIQPVKMKAIGVRRPAQLAITPRIELWRYEISMPFSLYEYKQFRTGLAIRLGQLVVGSDYFTSMTGLSKFNGFDFYVGIKHSNYAMDKLAKRKKGNKKPDTYNIDNL
jgi:hypothetical protein